MAAGGDRHIPEIKMRVEPENRIRNIRVEARHEFCDLEIFQDAFTAARLLLLLLIVLQPLLGPDEPA